jgi:hypothetical protein
MEEQAAFVAARFPDLTGTDIGQAYLLAGLQIAMAVDRDLTCRFGPSRRACGNWLNDALATCHPDHNPNSRAGSHRWGYKEPTDAAWELLEETVEPFLEDMKRQAELQSPATAVEILKDVVVGLYRLRHEPDGGTVLGWAPDFAAQSAMWAVEMWSTGGGGTWKVRRARRDRATFPEALVETYVPEWRTLIAQALSRSRNPRP